MIRTILLAVITVASCYLLSHPQKVGDTAIPAMGSFLSPFHGFWQNATPLDPATDQTIDALDLKGPVEVIYDERMVPHIFADHTSDALTVQGYLHAKHRLWQMDISIRDAAGRLAEIMGPDLLNKDLDQRRQGMLYAAENAVKGWSKFEEDYKLLGHYIDGINTYISSLKPKDYPLEFKLLGYEPEEWTSLHSALFLKNMAMTLCSGYNDIESSNLLKHFGQEKFDYLFPEYNDLQSPIIPENVQWDTPQQLHIDDHRDKDIGFIKGSRQSTFQPGIGSNNWAVDGTKTKSGNPILCGDPHLQLTLPSIWYELQINAEDINSYGVSLPGIPGIIIGFNEHIAWSETNVGHDVWDFYTIDWIDDAKTQYRINGQVKEAQLRIEEIAIKGGTTVYDTLKMTELGIVNKYESAEHYEDLAFDWLPHRVPDKPELSCFLDINRATNYEEFSQALNNYIAPAQNFAFASVDGDIAIHVNGDLPLKPNQAGRFVADGSKGSHWEGIIPRTHNPKVHNPERGFISSANQNSTNPDYPYYYNSTYFEQYRGRILNDKLTAMNQITPQDMMALQYDATSYKAMEAVPLLLDIVNEEGLNEMGTDIIKELKNWDYVYTPDSKAASYFNRWWSNIYYSTFDEIVSIRDEMEVIYPQSSVLVKMLTEDRHGEFFDLDSTTVIEDANYVVNAAFTKTIADLEEKLKTSDLQWSNYQKKSINHLARIGAFSHTGIHAPGHGDALNAYGSTAGPSWRMVVSMDEQVTAKVIYPGGQDGNPGNKHYDDMIDRWVEGGYYDAHFVTKKEALNKHKSSSITFN